MVLAPLPPLTPSHRGGCADTARLRAALLEGSAHPSLPAFGSATIQAQNAAAEARLGVRLGPDPAFGATARTWLPHFGSWGREMDRADAEAVAGRWARVLLYYSMSRVVPYAYPVRAALHTALEARFGLAPGRAGPPIPCEPRTFSSLLRYVWPEEQARQFHDPAAWAGVRCDGQDVGLPALVNAVYAETQEWLAVQGVRQATLYRGLGLPAPARGTVGPLDGWTLQSWTPSPLVARLYATGAVLAGAGVGRGQVLRAVVPAARIWGCVATGAGYATDAEVMVLGGGAADRVHRHGIAVRPPPRGVLDDYRPDPDWYQYAADGQHGMEHGVRTLLWADHAAARLVADGVVVDRVAVRIAALLHDCRRANGGHDPQHGARAAAWFGAQAATIAPSLTPDQVARIQYCMTWHVPPDDACPVMTPELACVKDADGLERVRFSGFDPAYLRLPYLRREEGRAYRLFQHSVWTAGEDPKARERAVKRGADCWDRLRVLADWWGLWPRPAG